MKQVTVDRKTRRKMRVSSNIKGTESRPRISVFRSSKYIYAQAIDDVKRVTICSFSSKDIETKEKVNKAEAAKKVGVELAALLKAKKIEKGVFDRGAYTYLGRVAKLAEGLREGGLII